MTLRKWIDTVNQTDRGLAALLRGVLTIIKSERLTFVWTSQHHKDAGSRRESDIRRFLGGYANWEITHISHDELIQSNPMLQEVVALRGKIRREICSNQQ
jgi:hypothetical protein